MSTASTLYAELELGLHCRGADTYQVELRFTNPKDEAEMPPETGLVTYDPAALLALQLDPRAYGRALAAQVFASEAIRLLYGKVKVMVEASGLFLRLRLLIGPTALELHGLRWELLCDPETGASFATSEKILFSRFMVSQDWRPVKLRRKAELRALIAVAAPSNAGAYNLTEVDLDGEIARAQEGLGAIRSTVLGGREQPLTLERLADGLRSGPDILYLVCHGALVRGQAPYLFFQDDEGNVASIEGAALAERIHELQAPPRLVVLASCESGGTADGSTQAALAPLLAEAGVPAVVAMQGQITLETVKKAMPVFFAELMKDGQIDRALAVARGTVRERPDFWMPALYLRLKYGRIWYEPGFAGETGGFDKWKSICLQVRQGNFIPILGPDIGEAVTGTTRELAGRLADAEELSLEDHERTDLAKVTQHLSIDQGRNYASNGVRRQLKEQILKGRSVQGARSQELPDILDAVAAGQRSDEDSPYRILSELPASIYINASAETLLDKSLRLAGRPPKLLVCDWRPTEESHPRQPSFEGKPSVENPIVYHVFGVFGPPGTPDTLVLTEDDFFDYLIATSAYKLIPTVVSGSLTNSSLLFLGFPLDGWTFRVLFRLIMTLEGCSKLRPLSHVGVQVDPEAHSQADVERARKYLQSYFRADRGAGRVEPQIDIYWGSAADFLKELQFQLATTKDEVSKSSKVVGHGWY